MADIVETVKHPPKWGYFVVGVLLGAFVLGAPLMAGFVWLKNKFGSNATPPAPKA